MAASLLTPRETQALVSALGDESASLEAAAAAISLAFPGRPEAFRACCALAVLLQVRARPARSPPPPNTLPLGTASPIHDAPRGCRTLIHLAPHM